VLKSPVLKHESFSLFVEHDRALRSSEVLVISHDREGNEKE